VVNLDIDWMDVLNLEIKLVSMQNESSFKPSVETTSEEMDLDVHLANLRAKLLLRMLLHLRAQRRRRRRSTRNRRQIKLYLLSTLRNRDNELLQPPRSRRCPQMTTLENEINLEIDLMIPTRFSRSFDRSYDSSASAQRPYSTLLGCPLCTWPPKH
jgi:hypothetical protein